MRSLIVDDEEAIRRLFERLLNRKGWAVEAAASSQEALEAFEPGRFELVFLDIDLGAGPDGVALAAQLRNRDAGLRIVMMSGRPENAARVDAAGLGPMLEKPFDMSRILALLGS